MKSDDLDSDCPKTGFASSFGTIVCNANHINARGEPRPEAAAQQRLEGVGFRVEPMVTPSAPPQTRTCAMNADGSSVTRVSAPLWRIPVLPCTANQILWTILGIGRAYVSSSCWHFSQRIAL